MSLLVNYYFLAVTIILFMIYVWNNMDELYYKIYAAVSGSGFCSIFLRYK